MQVPTVNCYGYFGSLMMAFPEPEVEPAVLVFQAPEQSVMHSLHSLWLCQRQGVSSWLWQWGQFIDHDFGFDWLEFPLSRLIL